MKLDHFENHKRKYISFSIIAILVVCATYLVVKSEAQGSPLTPEEEYIMLENRGRNCLPVFLHFPRIFFFMHPCMRISIEPTVIPAVTESITTPETETASSSDIEASSSPSSALSTQASSTPAEVVTEATTTEEVALNASSTETANSGLEATSTEEVSTSSGESVISSEAGAPSAD
jgi:hypothetical protein